MDKDKIDEISRISKRLVELKEELTRYYKEEYLHETEKFNPRIVISIGNNPTYLRDFKVAIFSPNTRKQVVYIAIKEVEKTIKELESKFTKFISQ